MSRPKENGLHDTHQRAGTREDRRRSGASETNSKALEQEPLHRTAEFQFLVKRFIIQLRYGCNGPTCTAPHCLTCKTRIATKPFRKPNIYTARMQAYTLASSKDSYAYLCPNEPKYSLEEFDRLEDAITSSLVGKQHMDAKSLVQSLFSTTAFREFERRNVGNPPIQEDQKSANDHVLEFRHLRDTNFMLRAVRDPETVWSQGEEVFRLNGLDSHWKLNRLLLNKTDQRELIYDNLWHAAGDLFPSPTPKPSGPASSEPRSAAMKLSDAEAVHIIIICFHALFSQLKSGLAWCDRRTIHYGTMWRKLRQQPKSIAAAHQIETSFPPALRLLDRLVRAIAARRCAWEIAEQHRWTNDDKGTDQPLAFPLIARVLDVLKLIVPDPSNPDADFELIMPAAIADWIEALIKQNWDGEPVVSRWAAVGGGLEILKDLCRESAPAILYVHMLIVTTVSRKEELNVQFEATEYRFSFDSEILDVDHVDPEFCMSWVEHIENPNTKHLLEFPFLFPKTLAQHFRTINYAKMFMAYRTSGFISHMSHHLDRLLTDSMIRHLHKALKQATTRYIVLDLRREHMLEDAFDQLRGREKRELLRPLKVRMGITEGMEIGVDQGGVAQEFFRLVFQKAFDPDCGKCSSAPQHPSINEDRYVCHGFDKPHELVPPMFTCGAL